MNALATTTSVSSVPVKPANAIRGKGYHDQAVVFSETFPIGAILTPEKFDEWAHQHGFLNVPNGAPKHSDVWLAHLQRRHQLRYSLNKAATHPRMFEEHRRPFTIDYAGQKIWEVRAPHEAIRRHDTARKLEGLATVQRRKLLYLQQSEDFSLLAPDLRNQIAEITDAIEEMLERTQLDAKHLQRHIDRVETRIQASLASGEVKPVNGGIAYLLEKNHEPDDESI
jgi:hypothetical protein